MKSTAEVDPLRFALAGMIAMAVGMGIGRFAYTPLLPGMMDDLQLSASSAGLIAASNFLGYLLGAIGAAGGWAHGHERRIMFSALAANAILAAAMGLTENLNAFLAIRFLAGVASAFIMVFSITIVFSHLASAGRNGLQAVHFGGVGVGIVLSAAITGAMHLAGAAWSAGWLYAGAVSLLGILMVARMIDRGPLETAASGREPHLPRSKSLSKIIIAYGMFGFGYVISATFIVAIVRQGEGGRLLESGVWMVAGLAGIVSVHVWNRVVPLFGLTATFALGCLVEAVGVLASVSLGGYAGPIVGGILLGGTFIAVTAIGLQVGRLHAPLAPRRVLALMTAAFGVGQVLGPAFAGYIADWTGSFVAPSYLAALALLLCAVLGYDSGRTAAAIRP